MNSFARIFQFSKPYWWRIAIAMVASAAVGALDGAFAYLVAPLLKKIFASRDLTFFAFLPAIVILIFIVRSFGRFMNDYYIRTSGELAILDIRNRLYQNCLSFSMRYFNANSTGGLMSRILNDVGVMQSGVANVVTGIFRDGLSAVALLGVIFYRSWLLAIIAFVVIPVTVWPAQKIGKRIKRLSNLGQMKMADLSGMLQETFAGIKVIKAFGLEQTSVNRFKSLSNEYYGFVRRGIKHSSLASPVIEIISSFGIAAVVWVGGSMVIKGSMTAEEFFSFVTAMMLLYKPLKSLNNSYNMLQAASGAAVRVFEVMDQQAEIVDRPDAVTLGNSSGSVEFRSVGFSYGDEPVLDNISLSAQRNQVIALVGPSGGGKSTLVSLIPRFYDVQQGQVLIDGHDIRNLTLESLSRNIALVDQETTLFHDTIAGNIRYGKPDATQEEIELAAKAAFVHDFVSSLPEGYQTVIGDRGVRLSGGQRQRICIARALIKNAPILILDEATSALDTESEKMVQQALDNLMKNRTTFVIAHRLSTILHADRIVVIEGGKIAESGTHNELINSNGLYKRLHAMQFVESAQPETI